MMPPLPEMITANPEGEVNPYLNMTCDELRFLIRELEDRVPEQARREGINLDDWDDFDAVIQALRDKPGVLDAYCELVLIEDTFHEFGSDETCVCVGCVSLGYNLVKE